MYSFYVFFCLFKFINLDVSHVIEKDLISVNKYKNYLNCHFSLKTIVHFNDWLIHNVLGTISYGNLLSSHVRIISGQGVLTFLGCNSIIYFNKNYLTFFNSFLLITSLLLSPTNELRCRGKDFIDILGVFLFFDFFVLFFNLLLSFIFYLCPFLNDICQRFNLL